MIATVNGEPPVRVYALLLQRLDALMAAGKGNDPEADAIRDKMDAPWYAMTDRERSRVDLLSEDLYDLSEGRDRSVPMTPEQRKQYGEEIGQALATCNWDRVLELIRRPPTDLPRQFVNYMRALTWEHLGDLEVALRFTREAKRLDPTFGVYVLFLLQRLGRTEETEALASKVLSASKAGR